MQRSFAESSSSQYHNTDQRRWSANTPTGLGSERHDVYPLRGGGLKTTPIAILSILSPLVPYPVNLRTSLDHLSMHLATTFSLCRHHTALETELAGLKRRRPDTPGFGALNPEGRPVLSSTNPRGSAQPSMGELASRGSIAGSMTSLSDYSSISRSAVCSPGPAPNVIDQIGATLFSDRADKHHVASPLVTAEDGYFSASHRSYISRGDGAHRGKPAQSAKDERPEEKRRTRGSSAASSQPPDLEIKLPPNRCQAAQDPGRKLTAADANAAHEGSGTAVSEVNNNADAEASWQALSNNPGTGNNDFTPSQRPRPSHRHTVLHSYGADFATTFPSLPPSSTISLRPNLQSRSASGSGNPNVVEMPPPSDKLKGLILDSLPAHVFVALPQTGEVVWVSSRYLSYRGLTVGDLVQDPWGSIHEEDREEYLKAWSHCLRTGEQFYQTVRIRRFDGAYRWFYARAVASRDKRGVIHHFLGSYMDIHDQRVAEIKASRQEQLAASEAKYKLLANLIPQIIFTATHSEGITSANDQWLSYTGQSFNDSLGLGFMDYVHPADLAKCRIPSEPSSGARSPQGASEHEPTGSHGLSAPQDHIFDMMHFTSNLSMDSSRDLGTACQGSEQGGETYKASIADLTELIRKGIVKVTRDSSGRLSYTTELRLRSKSGEYRWHLVRCVEIDTTDLGDGESSYFGSATDINDQKLLEAKLKEAMDSKSRFLSNMSHEIRTPLIGISGMVSFLQDTELNEEQRDHTNTIQTSANSLLMIINDILDLSKVAAGMMKLKYEWFHTRALIEDVNELVSTMAIAKRLELNYIVDEDVPALVKGDKIRIRQVLLNVIGNAIKFTSEGEVFSRCKVYHQPGLAPNEIMLKFDIIDTGRGFTTEEAELIFKPFSQIDGSSTRQHGGSGLGLVISRQLVELHGGKMEGTAVPNQGSTFTFTAKFVLPTEDDYPEVRPNSPPPLARKTEMIFGDVSSSPMTSTTEAGSWAPPASSQMSNGMETELVSSEVNSDSNPNFPALDSRLSRSSERATAPSVDIGLARFSEAARATGHDISKVTLALPRDRTPPGSTSESRLPLYSILIVCPQTHSREATGQHIATTIPKNVPYQITALDSAEAARKLLGAENGTHFTHVVLNLPTAEAIISLVEQTLKLKPAGEHGLNILVLSDTVQRQQVLKLAAGTGYEKLLSAPEVSFVYKPVKPSRFAVIFDPEKVRDLSIDRNRSTAQRMVESQKASYLEIVKRMGNKGYKVLLVEDNPVNQKVLTKYLTKVGVSVDIATDGADCTDMVFSKPYGYYSLILVGPPCFPRSRRAGFFCVISSNAVLVLV
jgi:PAS domain S-box-containing protein